MTDKTMMDEFYERQPASDNERREQQQARRKLLLEARSAAYEFLGAQVEHYDRSPDHEKPTAIDTIDRMAVATALIRNCNKLLEGDL